MLLNVPVRQKVTDSAFNNLYISLQDIVLQICYSTNDFQTSANVSMRTSMRFRPKILQHVFNHLSTYAMFIGL